jgi:hypothetical protein
VYKQFLYFTDAPQDDEEVQNKTIFWKILFFLKFYPGSVGLRFNGSRWFAEGLSVLILSAVIDYDYESNFFINSPFIYFTFITFIFKQFLLNQTV